MTTTLATLAPKTQVDQVIALAIAGAAPNTRRAYERAIASFTDFAAQHGDGFTRQSVLAWKQAQIDAGAGATTINQSLSAVRRLAREAHEAGLIDEQTAGAISRVKGQSAKGQRLGNWLTLQQATELVNSPDVSTLLGLRDRAILAVLVGAGLRREEVTRLTVGHFQQRQGRWVIVDLTGKHGRVRSVPIAAWSKFAVDAYLVAASIAPDDDTPIFRSIRRGGHIQPDPMTDQAIYDVVKRYATGDLAAHDLRRTFAKLARKAGAPLEQIQLTLGHASIATTQKYLGSDLDLAQSPSDLIGVTIDA